MILTEAQTTGLHTIEEAILDIKNGKVIIVVDDEDRENEGDFICAAAVSYTHLTLPTSDLV